MRLSNKDKNLIISAIDLFIKDIRAELRIFGSRVDDNLKGGDIDLLIIKETSERFIDRWSSVRRILTDPKRTIALEALVLTPQELSERLAKGDQFLAEILKKGEVLYAA